MRKLNSSNKKYKIILITLFVIIFVMIICIEFEGAKVDNIVEEFTSRGVYQTTENYIAYYKVPKEYIYEDTDNRIVDSYNDIYVGTTGDVYISSKDPLNFFLSEYISNNIRIGHSAIVYSEGAKTTVEVTGNAGKENNVVKEYENDWFKERAKEIIVMRRKDINSEDKRNLQLWLTKQYNKKYNYFFLLHMQNRFYCLDLCSRAYESIGKDIDGKSLATLGSSIIKNEDMYIIYYKKKVNKENINYEVYYLSEE